MPCLAPLLICRCELLLEQFEGTPLPQRNTSHICHTAPQHHPHFQSNASIFSPEPAPLFCLCRMPSAFPFYPPPCVFIFNLLCVVSFKIFIGAKVCTHLCEQLGTRLYHVTTVMVTARRVGMPLSPTAAAAASAQPGLLQRPGPRPTRRADL